MLQKRHFELIAKVLNSEFNAPQDEMIKRGVLNTIIALADAFEMNNERFDRGRFMRASMTGQELKQKEEREMTDLADNDQFQCIKCGAILDIEDSVQTEEGLRCFACAGFAPEDRPYKPDFTEGQGSEGE